jgi:hypothetical protein
MIIWRGPWFFALPREEPYLSVTQRRTVPVEVAIGTETAVLSIEFAPPSISTPFRLLKQASNVRASWEDHSILCYCVTHRSQMTAFFRVNWLRSHESDRTFSHCVIYHWYWYPSIHQALWGHKLWPSSSTEAGCCTRIHLSFGMYQWERNYQKLNK